MEDAFHGEIDYAMLVKHHSEAAERAGRYSPGICTCIEKAAFTGNPDPAQVSTSYAERSNLMIRMQIRRFTRLTNAFSKKIDDHAHAVALYIMAYNIARVRSALPCSLAMAAGVSQRLWDISDVVTVIEEGETRQEMRSAA